MNVSDGEKGSIWWSRVLRDSKFPSAHALEFTFSKEFPRMAEVSFEALSLLRLRFKVFQHILDTVSHSTSEPSQILHPSPTNLLLCINTNYLHYGREYYFLALESLVGLAQLHSVKQVCLRAACVAAVCSLSGSLMDVARTCCRLKYFNHVCLRILPERMDTLLVRCAWGRGVCVVLNVVHSRTHTAFPFLTFLFCLWIQPNLYLCSDNHVRV